MPRAKVIRFPTATLVPGTRVVVEIDGQRRSGWVHDNGLTPADLWIGPPDGAQQHLVAVSLDAPQFFDASLIEPA